MDVKNPHRSSGVLLLDCYCCFLVVCQEEVEHSLDLDAINGCS